MKNPIAFLKKGLIFFERENKKNIKSVEEKIKKFYEHKPENTMIKKDIETNSLPDYNDDMKKIHELEEQLRKK